MSEPTGKKYDTGKPRMGLISDYALFQEARVMEFGARKYADNNWRGGLKWSRLVDAALRHIHSFNCGEDLDPETGLHHLAHARCCLAFLLEFTQTHPELDDRYNFVEVVNDAKLREILAEADREAKEGQAKAAPQESVRENDLGALKEDGTAKYTVRGVGDTVHDTVGLQP